MEDTSTSLGNASTGVGQPQPQVDDSQRADADLQRSIVHARLFGGPASSPRIGRYQIVDTIGEGGMGTVYKGLDEQLDRHVALKRLKAADATPDQRERILREARALGKLAHPNIVAVFEAGEHEDALFFAMEYVPGMTLRAWAEVPGRSWREIVEHYLQAGRGLAAAHQAGLVHRDFKPHNAIVGEDDRVRVLDFGLVTGGGRVDEQVRTSPLDDAELTETGAIMGTPAYMAPEQIGSAKVDHRADQFSFCVSLYEALYGERPFKGWPGLDPDAPLRRGTPNGPPQLRQVLERGLAIEPESRFPDIQALLSALESKLKRRRHLLVGAGLVALGGLGLGAWVSVGQSPCREDVVPSRTWNAARRADVQSAFSASSLPFAETASARTLERLDTWATAWTNAHHEACMDTHVRGMQSQARLDARIDCLELQSRAVRGVATLLASANDSIIARADAVTTDLPAPEACVHAANGSTDAQTRAALAEALQILAEARALDRAAQRADARALYEQLQLHPLLPTAPSLRIGVARLGAELLHGESGIHGAIDAWRASAHEAQRSGLDELAADILLDIAEQSTGELGRYDAERWIIQDAEGALARIDRPGDSRQPRIELVRARLLWNHGQPVEATRLVRAVLEQSLSPELRFAATAELGCALREQGAGDEAVQAFAESTTLAESTFGPDSPRIAEVALQLGLTQIDLDLRDDAQRSLARAQTLFEALDPVPTLELAAVDMARAQLSYARGDLRGAAALVADVVDAYEKHRGPSSPQLGEAYNAQGVFAFLRDDHAAALAAWRKALQIQRTVTGDTSPAVALLRSNIAESQLAMGQTEHALDAFDEALAVLTEHPDEHAPAVAVALKGRGFALYLLGRTDESVDALQESLLVLGDAGSPFEHAATTFGLSQALRVTQPERAAQLRAAARDEFEGLDAAEVYESLQRLLQRD